MLNTRIDEIYNWVDYLYEIAELLVFELLQLYHL